MCFLVEYPAFELGQACPGHLSQAGRCSQLEAPPRAAAAAPGSAGQWECSRAGRWLQGNVQPAGTPQAWAGSGVRGALAWPRARGHCQVLPWQHTEMHQGLVLQHRTVQAGLQSTTGIAQQTCAHEKKEHCIPFAQPE